MRSAIVRMSEHSFAVHEEEESWIALVGKQERCVRKRGDQLYKSSGS